MLKYFLFAGSSKNDQVNEKSWGRGVVALTCGPVKAKIAGPNPVAPAITIYS